MQYLGGMKRLQKDFPTKQISPKTRTVDIDKGLDRFYSCASTISPLQIDLDEFEDITTITPRYCF